MTPQAGQPAASRRLSLLLACAGALLGMAGVAVSAAAAHGGGSALATTAGQFCLVHAATIIGLAALDRRAETKWPVFALAGMVLFVGTLLFAGDLVAAGLAGWRPFPPAAPLGGLAMMAGWLLVLGGGLAELRRGS